MTTRSSMSRSPETWTATEGMSTVSSTSRRATWGRARDARGDHLGEVDELVRLRESTGLQLGECEELGDEGQEPARVGADPANGVELPGGELTELALGEELGVATDRGDRRTQLVAHAGDEGVLDPVDLTQLLDGLPLRLEGLHQPGLGLEPLGDVLRRAHVADGLTAVVDDPVEGHPVLPFLPILADETHATGPRPMSAWATREKSAGRPSSSAFPRRPGRSGALASTGP